MVSQNLNQITKINSRKKVSKSKAVTGHYIIIEEALKRPL